jgi:hypothetical protein
MQALISAPTLVALSGCCFFSPTFRQPDPPKATEEAVAPSSDRFEGDLSAAKPGEWVTYREKDGGTWTVKVLEVGDLVWIEIRRGAEVVQQKIRLPNRIVESFLWKKDRPQRQRLEQAPPLTDPGPLENPATGQGDRTIAGRKVATRWYRRTMVDSEGVLTEHSFEFSSNVPPIVTRSGDRSIDALASGGVVAVKTPDREWELVDFGVDARPSYEWPK